MKPQGVLFDLDNTLYDRDSTFEQWARWFSGERLGLVGDPAERAIVDFIEWDNKGYVKRGDFFARMQTAHPILNGEIPELVNDFRTGMLSFMRLDPATDRLLDLFAASNVSFGIVTNGMATQVSKIERLGLSRRTTCVYVSEVFGSWKPEAAIFLAAAESLNLRPQELLFVGDHPGNDIGGAMGVGMTTAWLHRGEAWPPERVRPDYIIDSLSDVAGILRLQE